MPADSHPTKNPADKGKPPPPSSSEGNVKETIESILVAFVLAFIFRAFVVEAFVIPTGSMAPTLMGAHMRFRCPDCGYRFDVNFSAGPGDDVQIPDYATTPPTRNSPDGLPIYYQHSPPVPSAAAVYAGPLHCPNCGFEVPANSPADPDNDSQAPPVYYGDRILVLKYLYLFQGPQPWDVVVFKSPSELQHVRDAGDAVAHYTENFIKRLVGLPGETILILDGDVYVKPQGSETYAIRRKPHSVQEDLWRIVYDNDFLPQGQSRASGPWVQPWTGGAGSGWRLSDAAGKPRRVFDFDNAAGRGEIYFNADANSKEPHGGFNDWLAYDQSVRQVTHVVGDLKLACYYERKSGSGALRLQMTKARDAFAVDVTPGKVALLKGAADGELTVLKSADVPELAGNAPAKLEFANVDYRVSLRVNGREVVATTDEDYKPDPDDLLRQGQIEPPAPTVKVIADRQACSVEHLGLWRDIFYINADGGHDPMWGTPGRPIELKPEEYFVLGDNSAISGDARMWDRPVVLPAEGINVDSGRVPARFMLGKAFFVYWPAGYRPFSKSFGGNKPSWMDPGLIPNFGDMRFIH